MKRQTIYRIIDANGNRAMEGLRVAEDICRFVIESKSLTQRYKILRHQLGRALREIDKNTRLIEARNSHKDIGADRKAVTGEIKKSIRDLLKSNCRRAEEALRVMEESCQIISPKKSGKFSNLRFTLYSLEKESLSEFPLEKLKYCDLYAITESSRIPVGSSLPLVKKVIQGGIKIIQLRDKNLDIDQKIALGKKIRILTRKKNVLFIVNDRPDIAFALQADGVHLGQGDFPIKQARRLLGHDIIIGVSTHSVKQAVQAEKDGADYISVGPIYPTITKSDALPAVGIKLLKQVRKKTTLPIVAIGGINSNNIKEVIWAGADMVAVISAITSAKNISKETQKLINLIKQAKRNIK